MHIEAFREYCLSKPGVTEGMPFGPDVLVFKVMGKIFVLCGIEPFETFNAKCLPERAIELREMYPEGVLPGYHMNKVHWNTLRTNGGVPEPLLRELIDHSYQLIAASLPRKLREELRDLG